MENMATLQYAATTFMYVLLGFGMHIVKKSVSDGIDWMHYLTEHRSRTWLAAGAGIISCLNLIVFRPDATPAEFAAIGYIVDSVFNKAPVPNDVKEQIEILKEKLEEKDSYISGMENTENRY